MWRLFRLGDGVEVGTVSMALRRADRLFRLDELGMVVSCGGVPVELGVDQLLIF